MYFDEHLTKVHAVSNALTTIINEISYLPLDYLPALISELERLIEMSPDKDVNPTVPMLETALCLCKARENCYKKKKGENK